MKVVRLLIALILTVVVVSVVSESAYAARGTACQQLAPKILERCPDGPSCFGLCTAYAAPGLCNDPKVLNVCFGLSEECKALYDKIEFRIDEEFMIKCDKVVAEEIAKMIYEYGQKCEVVGAGVLKEELAKAQETCVVVPAICKELQANFDYAISIKDCEKSKYIIEDMSKNLCDVTAVKAKYEAVCAIVVDPNCVATMEWFKKAISVKDCVQGKEALNKLFALACAEATIAQKDFDLICAPTIDCKAVYTKFEYELNVNKSCDNAKLILADLKACPEYPAQAEWDKVCTVVVDPNCAPTMEWFKLSMSTKDCTGGKDALNKLIALKCPDTDAAQKELDLVCPAFDCSGLKLNLAIEMASGRCTDVAKILDLLVVNACFPSCSGAAPQAREVFDSYINSGACAPQVYQACQFMDYGVCANGALGDCNSAAMLGNRVIKEAYCGNLKEISATYSKFCSFPPLMF